MKRKDSLKDEENQPYIDPEAITEYLELMNDFIKYSIGDEMEAYSPQEENIDPNRRISNVSDFNQLEEQKDDGFIEIRDRRFSSRFSEDDIIDI